MDLFFTLKEVEEKKTQEVKRENRECVGEGRRDVGSPSPVNPSLLGFMKSFSAVSALSFFLPFSAPWFLYFDDTFLEREPTH